MSNTRPGVEVTQEIGSTSTTAASPALVPCVVGPCFQIVEALDSEGAVSADAKYEDEEYRRIRDDSVENRDDTDLPTFLRRPVSLR